MTAREQIAEALNGAGLGCQEFDPNDLDSGCPDCMDLLRYADALMPLVDRLRADAAARALRSAANALGAHHEDIEVALGGSAYVRAWLRDRAVTLPDEVDQ